MQILEAKTNMLIAEMNKSKRGKLKFIQYNFIFAL